ncbi:MAG: acylneuraminate cytidylyltransferase family protein [Acidobacteriota bacterium]|nr:acylneuraminate cytidylyltransferase family protein [Acidobacteriota bacterium]
MNVLGIIPARGGSKGLPRKNIRPLAGKPLIQYSIEAAAASSRMTHHVLSSEDAEIIETARNLGSEVVIRPDELAGDKVPMYPVAQHALAEAEQRFGVTFDAVMVLQPIAPLRTAEDIDNAVELLESSGAESVIGVVRVYDHHPIRMKKIEDNRIQPFCFPEEEGTRRQDLSPPAYLRNGAIYLIRRASLVAGSLHGKDQCPYIMPADRSVNIDEPLDFVMAELLIKQARGEELL